MASLYPTLEDMSVTKMIVAESMVQQNNHPRQNVANTHLYPSIGATQSLTMYPGQAPSQNVPSVSVIGTNGNGVVATNTLNSSSGMLAPLTGWSVGMKKAHINHGIRQVTLCQDSQGKFGLRLLSVDNGIFVSFVMANSPASLAGVRFGDQVLQVNDVNCAGWTSDKAMAAIKVAKGHSVVLALRDRPFERTITMIKDSANRAGFGFKAGRIEKIIEDSSAARNGILTDHQLLEINGQNVVGLPDKEIAHILDSSSRDVTITVMPSKIFQLLVKGMATNLIRSMDHA